MTRPGGGPTINIYIKVEIPSRELDGRLLLGLVAAERGHDVLVGDFRTVLSHRHWLPPGIFHDKALIPSPHRMAHRAALVASGFVLTSQDEEHGLLGDFADWARHRFSEASLGQVGAAFAWGPRDADGLARAFPDRAGTVRATGSPRVDLWRPDTAPFHTGQARPGLDPTQEYVLIPTNLGVGSVNPWWTQLANLRAMGGWSEDEPAEWARYEITAAVTAFSGRLVRAIRLAARRFPELRFVVRPHQTEGEDGWRMLLGDAPNVSVIRSGSVSGWIRAARIVVGNGSTTGLEAAVSGVPYLAYTAGGHGRDLEVNRLGRSADSPEGLIDAIAAAADPDVRAAWFGPRDRAFISSLFAATEGPLAAERIVDAWEDLAPARGAVLRPRRSLAVARLHRAVGRLRAASRGDVTRSTARLDTAHKFPPLRASDVADLTARFRSAFGRFDRVEVGLVGPRMVRLRRRAA